MEPIAVLIVDDSSLMRQRLRYLLGQTAELNVVGEAADADECLALMDTLRPELVTVDLSLPGTGGLELVEILGGRPDPPLVVVITNYPYPALRERSLEAGAALFMSKSEKPAHLAQTVAALAKRTRRQTDGAEA